MALPMCQTDACKNQSPAGNLLPGERFAKQECGHQRREGGL
jgi:hypothetical protein